MRNAKSDDARPRILVTGGSGFIGRHVIGAAEARGMIASCLDLKPCPVPLSGRAAIVDLREAGALRNVIAEIDPDYVVHLAAYASLTANLDEMRESNVEGTRNLMRSLTPRVKRTVYTSTQLVVTMGEDPKDGTYFNPYTTYGQTKAEMERAIRAEAPPSWVIVRPGNIWGPHHPSFADAIFKYIAKGVYLHPSGPPIIRSYGFVSNAANQILDLMLAREADKGVFYVSDEPIDSGLWADTLSYAVRGRRVRRVPRTLLRALGKGGDIVKSLGLPVPIDSGRVLRMTTNYAVPVKPTLAITSPPGISLEKGAMLTQKWLETVWR